MCHTIKTLATVSNGELLLCTACNIYHLTYNNIHFEFTPEEFDQFKKYLLHIEVAYWEERFSCRKMGRSIPIPSLQQNLILVFNSREIQELRALVLAEKRNVFHPIALDDINYTLVLN
jgi:hypothetical protein